MSGKKKAVVFVATALAASAIMWPSYKDAQAAQQVDVTVTTDQASYKASDSIRTGIHIQNNVDQDLYRVTVRGTNPENYTSSAADPQDKAAFKYVIDTIPALESEDAEIVFKPTAARDSGNAKREENTKVKDLGRDGKKATANQTKTKAPKTGDMTSLMVYILLSLAAGVGGVGIYVLLSKKDRHITKKGMSLALAVCMIGGLIAPSMKAKAAEAETKEPEGVHAEKVVQIDGKDVKLTVDVTYFNKKYVTETPEKGSKLSLQGYQKVWGDEFDGDTLNRDDWNVELHPKGWVNAEWQEYVDDNKTLQVSDGKLHIKPVKEVDAEGNEKYTSARVSTQNKKTFTYGVYECRAKVPTGMGYLPAFWLMANDESTYGQWPSCGEIDAMEVMGQEPDKLYGTLHYGTPHKQSQGTYVTSDDEKNFAEAYHVFDVEWLPGRINWYVDGKLYHTENDWYSSRDEEHQLTYPAPFDQPYYIILNLAIGGSWVGNPDQTTTYADQSYDIDYVRVYQKDAYDENVDRPDPKPVVSNEADAEGNYIHNKNFVGEDFTDETDWRFGTQKGGQGTITSVADGAYITTDQAGTESYAVQLLQRNVPLDKGGHYTFSFDAKADQNRKMVVDIEGPNNNWTRYFGDKTIELTTEKKHYTYDFVMNSKSDPDTSVEFNFGALGSTHGVTLSNVKLIKTAQEDLSNNNHSVLSDGNYVYNGGFDQGNNRLGNWTKVGTKVSVSSEAKNVHRLVLKTKDSGVRQDKLSLSQGKKGNLTYEIQGPSGATVTVKAYGQTYVETLDGSNQSFSHQFTAPALTDENGQAVNTIEIISNSDETVYVDNVKLMEDAMIKNGSFDDGTTGFSTWHADDAGANVAVDNLKEGNNNALEYTIWDTGIHDWSIQLAQGDLNIQKGHTYCFSMRVRSDRAISTHYEIRNDGNLEGPGKNNWDNYAWQPLDLKGDNQWQPISCSFTMDKETNPIAQFYIPLGAKDGDAANRIQLPEAQAYHIDFDDIALVDVTE